MYYEDEFDNSSEFYWGGDRSFQEQQKNEHYKSIFGGEYYEIPSNDDGYDSLYRSAIEKGVKVTKQFDSLEQANEAYKNSYSGGSSSIWDSVFSFFDEKTKSGKIWISTILSYIFLVGVLGFILFRVMGGFKNE